MHRFTLVAGLTAALALSSTAAAQAHPGWYEVDARLATTFEEQTVTVTGGAGTFKPSANAASVAFDATAAQVEQALWADPAIGYDNVDVSGPAGGPYVIRWTGTLAGKVVAPIAPAGAGGATAVVAQGQQGGTAVTPATDPTGDTQATVSQYVLVNDGYTFGFTETNGSGGRTDGSERGMLNLKLLPGAYRATLPLVDWITYPAVQTGLQVHATCAGVAALQSPANIRLTQVGEDPFFGYIPWQSTTAGVGDDPAAWIGPVKTITSGLPGAPTGGVDLSALGTVAQLTSACTALGGTYHPADTRSATATALISDAVAPLNSQITDLTSTINALTGQRNAADAALAAAQAGGTAAAQVQAAALALKTRKVTAALSGTVSLTGSTTVKLSGPAGGALRVRMLLTQPQATKLRLKSLVLASKTQTLGADGTATARLSIVAKARKAARKASKKAITIEAVAVDAIATVRGR